MEVCSCNLVLSRIQMGDFNKHFVHQIMFCCFKDSCFRIAGEALKPQKQLGIANVMFWNRATGNSK